VTYKIYFGTTENPPLVSESNIVSTFDPGILIYNTVYYWTVLARDSNGVSTEGPIWKFATSSVPSPTPPSDGGSGTPPLPKLSNVNVSGLTSAIALEVNEEGEVQNDTELISDDGNLSLVISKDTMIYDAQNEPAQTINYTKHALIPTPPEETAIVSYCDLGPAGTKFVPPIILSMKFDPNKVPAQVEASNLYIAFWDGNGWVKLESTVNMTDSTLIARFGHFTSFAILAQLPPPSAKFVTTSLKVEPNSAQPGSTVTISLLLVNSGQGEGTHEVVLNIDGIRETAKAVTLTAGAVETIVFTVTRQTPDTYNVEVNGLKGNFTVESPLDTLVHHVTPLAQAPEPEPVLATPSTTPPIEPDPAAPEQEATISQVIIATIVIYAFIITISIYVLRRGRSL